MCPLGMGEGKLVLMRGNRRLSPSSVVVLPLSQHHADQAEEN